VPRVAGSRQVESAGSGWRYSLGSGKHFIRAGDHSLDQLLEAGSEANARAKGTLRLEGKDYIVQDAT